MQNCAIQSAKILLIITILSMFVLINTREISAQFIPFESPCFNDDYWEFKYKDVVKCLKKQIKKDPDNPILMLSLSRFYRVMQSKAQYAEMIEKANMILARKKQLDKLSLREKIEYLKLANSQKNDPLEKVLQTEINAEVEKLLGDDTQSPDLDTMVEIAAFYNGMKEYDKSMELLDRAIETQKDSDNPFKTRIISSLLKMQALTYIQRVDTKDSRAKGIKLLTKAVKTEPTDISSKSYLAFYYKENNDFRKATKLYRQLIDEIKYDRYQKKPYSFLADCYMRQKNLKEAEAVYYEGIKVYPLEYRYYEAIEKIYKEQNRDDDIIALYELGLKNAKKEKSGILIRLWETKLGKSVKPDVETRKSDSGSDDETCE